MKRLTEVHVEAVIFDMDFGGLFLVSGENCVTNVDVDKNKNTFEAMPREEENFDENFHELVS